MFKLTQFFREVKTELIKVVWPSRNDTLRMTLVVIVFSLGVAVFLGAIDYGLTRALEVVFK